MLSEWRGNGARKGGEAQGKKEASVELSKFA